MLNALRHVWRHPLNARSPLTGIVRFARWQIATRLLPGTAVAVPFTDRARLLIGRGMYGATQNVYCGLNDFPEMSLLLHYLRPGDFFVDVGANVGAYTVLGAAAAGATTYAFEPSPHALEHLRANVELNRIGGLVHIEPYAVGREPGTVRIETEGASAMHRVASEQEQPEQAGHAMTPGIEMRTLDSYGLRPAILKIDVEGYEAEVLAGAAATLASPELVAVITENSDDSDRYGAGLATVQTQMQQHGFAPFRYEPRQRALTPDQGRGDNTLYLRHLERIAERVRTAAPFHVFGEAI